MSMDFYRVKAKVYTRENISEGIPDGKWCFRLLLEGDTVRIVEAYSCENGGNAWANAPNDILDQDVFNEVARMEPGFYSSCDDVYEKYAAWVLNDLFYLERETVEDD